MMQTHENISGIGEISGLTTDLESTMATPGQPRQEAEDTINLSQDQ
jgi:hypothetical protein